MSMTDPIADMLTRIRNSNTARHDRVDIPGSKIKRSIAEVLKREGYIRDYAWIDDGRQGTIRIYLRYGPSKESVINGLKRISRPGLRIYAKKEDVPRVLGGLGIAILSTPTGIVTDREAREKGIGGEVICYVW
ncbi:MAG: 30S ribosomal protein S8 [Bacillota bacterium]|nr:MAG: 30S ribosomal protein S8 [Bacillota bacterium]